MRQEWSLGGRAKLGVLLGATHQPHGGSILFMKALSAFTPATWKSPVVVIVQEPSSEVLIIINKERGVSVGEDE